MLFVFAVRHLAVLTLLLACAAGAGTLATGRRYGVALRGAIGLMLWGQASFVLALAGQLRPIPLAFLGVIALAGGIWRGLRIAAPHPAFVLGLAPLFALTLYPPIAFDETLYHLPFVRTFAAEGVLRFLPEVRFPVFPVLNELLCVPAYLLAGDTGPHLMSLAQLILIAGLIVDRARRHHPRAMWLAAALFLGSPLVVHLAAVLYVDLALTLFVLAGYCALEDEHDALAGFFFGTACGVKYLGAYFALAALIVLFARRRRAVIAYILACAAAALPTTAFIVWHTGDPVFPFLLPSAWTITPAPSLTLGARAWNVIRLLYDVTFSRDRVGLQPPITPFLIVIVLAAIRHRASRYFMLAGAVYACIFTFLPPDSRYLIPLLPVMSIAAAIVLTTRWPRAAVVLALLAIVPGLAYAGYRLSLYGIPPATAAQRDAWLAERVPEYRALRRAGAERVYVCHAERLKSYAAGTLLGDHLGPYSYDRVLTADTQSLAANLRRIDVRYFLVARRSCPTPRANGGMMLVHEDEAAQLWLVTERGGAPD